MFTCLARTWRRLSQPAKVAFRRDNIGFVFQQYNLLPALTAAENAAVPLLIAGQSRHASRRAAEDCCAASAWATAAILCRPSFPAASSSAWPLPGR